MRMLCSLMVAHLDIVEPVVPGLDGLSFVHVDASYVRLEVDVDQHEALNGGHKTPWVKKGRK